LVIKKTLAKANILFCINPKAKTLGYTKMEVRNHPVWLVYLTQAFRLGTKQQMQMALAEVY